MAYPLRQAPLKPARGSLHGHAPLWSCQRVHSGASFELEDGADEDWLEWSPLVELGQP